MNPGSGGSREARKNWTSNELSHFLWEFDTKFDSVKPALGVKKNFGRVRKFRTLAFFTSFLSGKSSWTIFKIEFGVRKFRLARLALRMAPRTARYLSTDLAVLESDLRGSRMRTYLHSAWKPRVAGNARVKWVKRVKGLNAKIAFICSCDFRLQFYVLFSPEKLFVIARVPETARWISNSVLE
jgi:hypothetical protein